MGYVVPSCIFPMVTCPFKLTGDVREALTHPDKVVRGSSTRLIAQKGLDERQMLRVVFIQQADRIRLVTLYPARRERY